MSILDARSHITHPEGYTTLNAAQLRGIAIHHSAGRAVEGTEADEIAHIRAIDRLHEANPSIGIFGYHAVVFPSGRAYQCGDFNGQRAHVRLRNHELLGVCLIGTFTDSLPSQTQVNGTWEAIDALRDFWQARDAYVLSEIRGHNEWAIPSDPTACPGRVMEALVGPVPPEPTPRDCAFAGGAFATFLAEGRDPKTMHPYDQQTIRWMARQL